MCEPSPGTSPKARTSKTPPSDSFCLRSVLISLTIARLASASRQRTGDSSTWAKSAGVRSSRRGAVTEVICSTCEKTSTPSARRNSLATAPPATRAAVSRALARSRMSRTSVSPYFCVPTRSAWPGRGRCTSGVSRLHRPGIHPLFPVGEVAVVDLDRDRPAERASVPDPAGDVGAVASRSSCGRRGRGRAGGARGRGRAPRARAAGRPEAPR